MRRVVLLWDDLWWEEGKGSAMLMGEKEEGGKTRRDQFVRLFDRAEAGVLAGKTYRCSWAQLN